jgi:hypothetical protein
MKNKIYKVLGVALVVMLLASLTVGLATAPAGAAVKSKLKWAKLTLPKVEDWNGYNDRGGFVDAEGDFWCTPGADVGPIAVAPDGKTIFAAVADGFYLGSDWFDVLKSTDGGYTWVATHFFDEWSTAAVNSDLAIDIDDDDTPIPVEDSSDFPTSGTLWIEDEMITYDGITGDDLGTTSCNRGANGTTAADHDEDVTVGIADGSPIVDIVVSPDYADDTTVFVATEWTVYQSVDAGKNFICMEEAPVWAGPISDMDVTLDDRERSAIIIGADDDVYVFSTETGLSWQEQLIYDTAPFIGRVIAVAFSPTFADDEGVFAMVSDGPGPGGETWMRCSFGNTADGGGWGTDIGDAQFTNADGDPYGSWYARMAFPDDFDAFGVDNNVCFVGITTWFDYYWGMSPADDIPPEDLGDAYKVEFRDGAPSRATDLDVRGVITTLLPTATEVTSIDVSGDADSATIIVGVDSANLTVSPESFFIYYSTDSGETWEPAAKRPTGGTEYNPVSYPADVYFGFAMPKVVMAPDFDSSSTVYCSTWGYMTDAFQRSTDGGDSWSQISLIDYGDPTAGYDIVTSKGLDASGFTASGTLRMVTRVGGNYGAVWERTEGKHFERFFSYANLGVTDLLKQVKVLGDVIFVTDYDNGYIWRSSNTGATFPKKITTKDELSAVGYVSSTTLYTGHSNGELWWSTKSGVGWTKPEDNEVPATTEIISVGVKGDIVIIAADDGFGYISSDGGETVESIGLEGPFTGGPTIVVDDLGFTANSIVYATNPAPPWNPGGGVWRCEVDLDDPHSSEWEQIDDSSEQPEEYDPATFTCGGPFLTLPPNGVGYVIDGSVVDTGFDEDYAGGLWRCTNPTADVDSIYPPYFEKENKGLDGGEQLDFLCPDVGGPPSLSPTLFAKNLNYGGSYWEQVWMFTDTLNTGVPLVSPTNNEIGVGLVPEGKVHPETYLVWDEMAGATDYQWQLALDSEFKSVIIPEAEQFASAMTVGPLYLTPNTTYYWRVRVAKWGSIYGAPLISPWSETFKFKTAIGAVSARPDLEAPWAGEEDVELMPTFEWSGIEWAVKYEFELATDPTTGTEGYFTTPLKALTGANALVSTAWKSDITLQYDTRYYWHVIAIGVDTSTPWSDVGTFTTMSEPAPAPSPQPPVEIPPVKEITPAWIWAIVIIGAILVIAVIVLIVTTRRVP